MTKKYQVVGIGNALVDVLCHTDDAFLEAQGIGKGVMQLIDRDRAVDLYGQMGPSVEVSGGSAANTIAGVAALGGRTAYVGKVKDDQLGAIFAHDMRAQGADYATPLAGPENGHETGRCMVLVTPDGERSMSTYLGVSEHLGPEDIDPGLMEAAEWLYLEGYRFDGPDSHEAFARAIGAARGAGGKVALTLSDPFCIQRHRDAFRRMIVEDLDLLFCNRAEMCEMYGTDDLDAALGQACTEVETIVCTDSEHGAHVLKDGERWLAPAVPTKIVDATGAGDLFAAGYLWGITHGHTPMTAAQMGNVAASEVISHIGARPEADLMQLYREHGLV